MKFYSLKNDGVFADVMSYEDIRKQLISDVTGILLEQIRTARLVSPYLWRKYRFQKRGILDVAVVLADGTKVDIELQIHAQKQWIKRKLFYLAKMYTQNLRVGEDYARLRKCISISIVDFRLIDGDDYHTVYTLKDKDGKELTDLFELHILELNKELKEGDPLNDWVRLFNTDTMEGLDMLRTKNTGINHAIRVVKEMNLGQELRWLYDEYWKAKRDRRAEDEYVRDEGRAEGMAVGKAVGMAVGKAESILDLLEDLGDVPETLRSRIMEQKDLDILRDWHKKAARAKSVEEFEKEIGNKTAIMEQKDLET